MIFDQEELEKVFNNSKTLTEQELAAIKAMSVLVHYYLGIEQKIALKAWISGLCAYMNDTTHNIEHAFEIIDYIHKECKETLKEIEKDVNQL